MKRRDKETVMDEETMERALARITHEILERNQGVKDLALIGIRTGGVYLAERIRDKIGQMEKCGFPPGSSTSPCTGTTSPSVFPGPWWERRRSLLLKEKKVVLVDDVLYTGRTVRAAMDALIDFGRPSSSSWRSWWTGDTGNFPSRPIMWARRSSPPQEEVTVTFRELEGQDRVVVQEIVPE